jgi:hypothetical protein
MSSVLHRDCSFGDLLERSLPSVGLELDQHLLGTQVQQPLDRPAKHLPPVPMPALARQSVGPKDRRVVLALVLHRDDGRG